MATTAKSDDSKVQVHHTKRGVLYADPEQILRSKNARRQIRAFKNSKLIKEIRNRQPE